MRDTGHRPNHRLHRVAPEVLESHAKTTGLRPEFLTTPGKTAHFQRKVEQHFTRHPRAPAQCRSINRRRKVGGSNLPLARTRQDNTEGPASGCVKCATLPPAVNLPAVYEKLGSHASKIFGNFLGMRKNLLRSRKLSDATLVDYEGQGSHLNRYASVVRRSEMCFYVT